MKRRTLLLSVLTLLTLSAFGGEKEEIVGRIKNLYDTIAQGNEEGLSRFACHTWWETVAAVEKKDANVPEIGFFNDDLWTQMQDSNPDHFEVRDVKFDRLDVEKGTALVDFVLWSTIQTVHQKFEFCREEGDWRVHNIIRLFTNADGQEEESDLLKAMTAYLAEPQESAQELIFAPNLDDINLLDLSDGKDNHKKFFPVWIPEDQVQEYDGVLSYDMTLVDDLPFQQLFKPLPGKPLDMNEVGRVIIFDLNYDGHSDALICLGSYGDDATMYFDAYVWDVDQVAFEYVEDFRSIPNPRIDENYAILVGRNGKDREIWSFDGLSKVEKTSEVKDFYQ